MIMNKRGISTIIATVLIVLITVAAVTILWAAVSPLIDNTADLNCFEVANAVKIDANRQYTYYNGTHVSVRVERLPNSDQLENFTITLESGGSTVGQASANDKLPTENGVKVYVFGLEGSTPEHFANTSALSDPKVAIVPAILQEGEVAQCEGGQSIDLQFQLP